ncbi:hypothetical protein R1sor_019422 [Riccia sorocarpa]|uniref:Reverse transcriptase domain-containing protein n=1 Tax=Riccia sorocarpa TaxID=122646 RepID=A0ABD3ICG8_9MARC
MIYISSLQNFLRNLQEAEKDGGLKGLKLPNLKAITHELFADDTSVFISAISGDFKKIKAVIERFERASGAALNMQKSLVLALGRREAPDWVRGTGCDIADKTRRFKFLGGMVGQSNISKRSGGRDDQGHRAEDKLHLPKELGGLGWCPLEAHHPRLPIRGLAGEDDIPANRNTAEIDVEETLEQQLFLPRQNRNMAMATRGFLHEYAGMEDGSQSLGLYMVWRARDRLIWYGAVGDCEAQQGKSMRYCSNKMREQKPQTQASDRASSHSSQRH